MNFTGSEILAEAQPLDAETPHAGGTHSHEILSPRVQNLPLVFASPHSGSFYPPEFLAASRLDPLSLRRSEDSFVDELFVSAPRLGAPLIRPLFPRAFIDPNREPFELDPAMFADQLPDYANTRSPRVIAGLGTIARVVANGADIYRHKLTFAEALARIRSYYWPYHTALRDLVQQTKEEFGFCILVDCHSMPSVGANLDRDPGPNRMDFVLGDCHGSACAPAVMERVELALRERCYRVARNSPYSGGFVTRHYGRPEEDIHCLQIEINRRLYMDESTIERSAALPDLERDMGSVVEALGQIQAGELAAR